MLFAKRSVWKSFELAKTSNMDKC